MIRMLVTAAMLMPGAAAAQARVCTAPPLLSIVVNADLPSEREPVRVLPIASYTLAISWSPQFCRTRAGDPKVSFQCGGRNRFGFVLHGLWPDGAGKEWPQYCAPAAPLPAATIRPHLCATPSAQLIQHEWAKHGTCMANETPDSFFRRSNALYAKLRYPDMNALSRRPLTAGQFAQAMARANPGVAPSMMRITADRDGWLDEVWLCLDLRFRTVTCPAHQGGLRPDARLRIWRGRS